MNLRASAPETCRVHVSILLDPRLHRIDQAFDWGRAIAQYAEAIDPTLLCVDTIRVDGATVWIEMVGFASVERLTRILDDHDGMRRFRTRVVDLDLKLNIIIDDIA
jgi:hypothetical protein